MMPPKLVRGSRSRTGLGIVVAVTTPVLGIRLPLVSGMRGRPCSWSRLPLVSGRRGRPCSWSRLPLVSGRRGRPCRWSGGGGPCAWRSPWHAGLLLLLARGHAGLLLLLARGHARLLLLLARGHAGLLLLLARGHSIQEHSSQRSVRLNCVVVGSLCVRACLCLRGRPRICLPLCLRGRPRSCLPRWTGACAGTVVGLGTCGGAIIRAGAGAGGPLWAGGLGLPDLLCFAVALASASSWFWLLVGKGNHHGEEQRKVLSRHIHKK
jgi:hypothetical protein